MFALIAAVLFFIAFIFIGAAVVVHTAWFTPPALIALGLAFLALANSNIHR